MFSPDELTPCALGPTRAPADFGIPTFWDPPEAYLYLPNPTYHDCHTTSIDHGNQTKGWCKDPLPVPQRPPPSTHSLLATRWWWWSGGGFAGKPVFKPPFNRTQGRAGRRVGYPRMLRIFLL